MVGAPVVLEVAEGAAIVAEVQGAHPRDVHNFEFLLQVWAIVCLLFFFVHLSSYRQLF